MTGKKTNGFLSTIFFVLLLILFIAQISSAASLNLAWNPNQEGDIAGYNIYYGTSSGDYELPVDAGLNTAYELSGLDEGETYYIALTAYDIFQNESEKCDEESAFIEMNEIYDYDGDGIPDGEDNCPNTYNPDQDNSDNDSYGDACDNCPYQDNENQSDADANGIGDVCEEEAPFEIVIEAEDMSYHDNGGQQGEFLFFWTSGTMSEDVYFPSTDIYRFEIVAKGDLAYDVGPEMGLLIDGEIIDTVFVDTETPEPFIFDVEVSAGTHEFAIGFYNDYWDPLEGIDQNLYVDKTTITVSPVLDIIEAEDMSYHDNGGQQGEFLFFWTSGTMSEDVYFPSTDIYRFEIVAKGDLAYDVGPEMGLLIDGKLKRTVFVNTGTPETFVLDVEVSAGTHEFAIGFYNDYWDPLEGIDQNLYVDKTTITVSPVLDIIEAEEMSYQDNGGQRGEFLFFWTNGVMSDEVYLPDTYVYRFEIIAKGDLAHDVGPEMGFLIDGEFIDTVFVNTETPESYVFDANVTAGRHELAIGFYNDYCDPSTGEDRNLYVDKIVLTKKPDLSFQGFYGYLLNLYMFFYFLLNS